MEVIAEEGEQSITILEVGCGRSPFLAHIDQRHEYFGVDIDPVNVEICRARFPARQGRFSPCESYHLPFESESIDLVFASRVIEYLDEPLKWLLELVRVLRPGGRLQLSTPNHGDLLLPLMERFKRKGPPPTPYTRASLYQILQQAGLEEVLVKKTSGALALVASARRPDHQPRVLDRQRLKRMWARLADNVPASLAARESMRMVVLSKLLPDEATVLDVGCGDGSVWRCFPGVQRLTLDGVDLNADEMRLAERSGVYRNLILADISKTQLHQTYDFVVGNCSMEHIPNIHGALAGIRGVLKPGGRLILLVPAFGWPRTMTLVSTLGLFSQRLAMAAAGALDGFFQHHHIYDSTSWRLLVENAQYEVERLEGMGSPAINQFFDQNLAPAALEFVIKRLIKRYAELSWMRKTPPENFFGELAEQPVAAIGPAVVEYVIVARPT